MARLNGGYDGSSLWGEREGGCMQRLLLKAGRTSQVYIAFKE